MARTFWFLIKNSQIIYIDPYNIKMVLKRQILF